MANFKNNGARRRDHMGQSDLQSKCRDGGGGRINAADLWRPSTMSERLVASSSTPGQPHFPGSRDQRVEPSQCRY